METRPAKSNAYVKMNGSKSVRQNELGISRRQFVVNAAIATGAIGVSPFLRAQQAIASNEVSDKAGLRTDSQPGCTLYTRGELDKLGREFEVPIDDLQRDFYFPQQSYLESGYAPPGGYVKDFCVIAGGGRWHVFHIDGRPEERCIVSGNELSFGHASTTDWRHWIRHRLPLAIGDRPWENEHMWAPFVIRYDSQYQMFYMAAGRDIGGVLTYATSNDLEVWKKSVDGPIPGAVGRDPFARVVNGELHLYYTGGDGIKLVKTRDLRQWSSPQAVITNPKRSQEESSSMYPIDDRYVIWFNDYLHVRDPSGDFRAVYVFSRDPERFLPENLQAFNFAAALPTNYGANDWIEKRPIPVSLKLIEQGKTIWLVCYFRWHIDRFRLFVGAIHWRRSPALVEEIVASERLAEVQSLVAKEKG